MVEIPPSFATNGELMILNHHINILVKGIRSDTNFKQDFVVDFNTAEYNGYYKTRKVADDDAIALYFSNVGVESMQAGESLQAFRYLKKAIHVSPSIPSLWVNLGALYSQHNLYQSAVQAYQQALVNQPSNKSALVNLANTLNHMGRHEEAQYYLGRVEYYRNHNPYYHYFLAKTSYAKNNYGSSLQHLTKAISLKRDEHQFHHLQGLTHYRLEDYERSSRSFERARKAALEDQQIAGYLKKLQALATRLN
jgi:Flp pilus assembly protein TadD